MMNTGSKKLNWIVFFIVINLNCEKLANIENKPVIEVDFSQTDPDTAVNLSPQNNGHPIYLAISSTISPKETYKYYKDLVKYISEKCGRPVQLKQRKTYQEILKLLEVGEIDFAFICSGTYVAAEGEVPIEIIAIPEVRGKHFYNAYIIVHKSSSIKKFKQLRNKSFAFTDPLSNTGYLYPSIRVKELGSGSEKFFKKTIYTNAHDYSIQAVARKIVDGASVNGLVFDYIKSLYPERVKEIVIIETSEPFGIPPIVVPKFLNPELKHKLRSVLLEIHTDPVGREILKKLQIDRFVPPGNTDYSSIRKNLLLLNK